MKVLMVVPEFPPYVVGGGGAVYERLARYLASRGHDLTVVHGDLSDVAWCQPQGVAPTDPQYRLVAIPLMRPPRRMAWLLSATPPTAAGLRRLSRVIAEGWDVAHVHGVGLPAMDLAAAMLRRRNVPYVYTIHGVPASPLHRGIVARTLLRTYLGTIARRTVGGAAQVTAVSAALLRDPLLPIAGGRVIHNGIEDVSNGAAQVRPDDGILRLLTVGRLSRNKGIDLAIRAVGVLDRAGVRVRLDVYGADGGEQEALRDLVRDEDVAGAISFRGTFAPSDRAAVFARYDGLVVPSRLEAFGLCALEGLSEGLPVIASAVDGLAEILTGNESLLVPPGDVAALAAAMQRLRDPALRARLIVSGRERARAFLWANALDAYERTLEECVA